MPHGLTDMTSGEVQLRIESSDDTWLSQIRATLRDIFGVESDANDDSLQEFLVAVTEVATNALEAHQRAGEIDPVVVEIRSRGRMVDVIDAGGGFDVDQLLRLPDPSVPRGRGLYLARELCPNIEWSHNGRGMTCRLVHERDASARSDEGSS